MENATSDTEKQEGLYKAPNLEKGFAFDVDGIRIWQLEDQIK
jgi:hypothetical protein